MRATSLLAWVWIGCSSCSSPGQTQPPVVVGGLSGAAGTCDDVLPSADSFDRALARARCEHPDMLVHPRCYRLERVPAPGQAHLYALSIDTPVERCDLGGTTSARIASSCVRKDGSTSLVDGSAASCRE